MPRLNVINSLRQTEFQTRRDCNHILWIENQTQIESNTKRTFRFIETLFAQIILIIPQKSKRRLRLTTEITRLKLTTEYNHKRYHLQATNFEMPTGTRKFVQKMTQQINSVSKYTSGTVQKRPCLLKRTKINILEQRAINPYNNRFWNKSDSKKTCIRATHPRSYSFRRVISGFRNRRAT